jgi:cytoskeletal protein CcmA (bactofilin family)
MRVERGIIEGDLEVEDDLSLPGMVTGNVTVLDGGTLELNGTCGKNLILEDGATAFLNGTVNGSVYNRGGKLEVCGIIYGSLHKEAGETFVDRNAVIQRGIV